MTATVPLSLLGTDRSGRARAAVVLRWPAVAPLYTLVETVFVFAELPAAGSVAGATPVPSGPVGVAGSIVGEPVAGSEMAVASLLVRSVQAAIARTTPISQIEECRW